eukprot:3435952-Alexandrium_andersonii.AAC.1
MLFARLPGPPRSVAREKPPPWPELAQWAKQFRANQCKKRPAGALAVGPPSGRRARTVASTSL